MKHAESVGKTKDDLVAEMSDQLILKRMGSTDEVAAAVLFLVRCNPLLCFHPLVLMLLLSPHTPRYPLRAGLKRGILHHWRHLEC